jgi:hypothetical protein
VGGLAVGMLDTGCSSGSMGDTVVRDSSMVSIRGGLGIALGHLGDMRMESS